MNILLLGSGGREHAFARKISESSYCDQLYIAPGNAGTAEFGTNVSLSVTDFDGIKKFVGDYNIMLVVVGPEDPLVNGIVDYFQVNEELLNIPVIGPGREGAKLEGSKDFAKQFMKRHNIPTAEYKTFTPFNIEEGFKFIDSLNPPYVLKADGLAAGKGVLILDDPEEAKQELRSILKESKFGEAGKKVVVEEFLKGIELSVFVLTDGESYKILPEAKDYKRIGEGDTGLNTGGMGAVSPVPFASDEFMKKVEERIVLPTVAGFKTDDISYKGFIFIGLMNVDGDPFVIEYNVRMGDPETEVVLPRIKSDILELFSAVAMGKLNEQKLEIDERTSVTVVMVSEGYPGNYEKGLPISGIENTSGSIIYHSGTQTNNENALVTNGGRVLAITSIGKDMSEALEISYRNAERINFQGKYYRKDIGKDLL